MKATELRALEEERFTTEERRMVARDRFRQDQAVRETVEERRRQLAAARVRNEGLLLESKTPKNAMSVCVTKCSS